MRFYSGLRARRVRRRVEARKFRQNRHKQKYSLFGACGKYLKTTARVLRMLVSEISTSPPHVEFQCPASWNFVGANEAITLLIPGQGLQVRAGGIGNLMFKLGNWELYS